MTEYEVKIPNIDIAAMRERLRAAGATLAKEMFTMRIATHHLPEGFRTDRSWLRVRDEGGAITLEPQGMARESYGRPKRASVHRR